MVGNTKLGRQKSKYTSIEKGGAGCIDIIKQTISIRASYPFEALTKNKISGLVFREAIEMLEIKKENIPRMANWELLTLAKLMKKLKLNFWSLVLQEYVTIRNKETNKNLKNISDSSLTEIDSKSTKNYLKKKITVAGGKTNMKYLSHFNNNNKINTEHFFRIDHIIEDNWNIPKKEDLEEFLNIDNLSKKQYIRRMI